MGMCFPLRQVPSHVPTKKKIEKEQLPSVRPYEPGIDALVAIRFLLKMLALGHMRESFIHGS
jgi:hypothetical protein